MRTIDYLTDPAVRGLFLPGVIAALAVAAMCGPLSVLVTLKRYAFIGQGVSHAAFGGVGLALLLGLEMGRRASGLEALVADGVVLAFAFGAAALIVTLRRRGGVQVDTAIGVVLVACMAAGFVMHGAAAEARAQAGGAPAPGLEAVLFGSILRVGWADVWIAVGASVAVLAAAIWARRRLMFWAFDETVSVVHGVRAFAMETLALTMISVATVVVMKTAGVVLATALLVLPGAAALRLRLGLWTVVGLAGVVSVVGVASGVVVSFEADLPAGPSIVGTLLVLYGAAAILSVVMARPGKGGAAEKG